MPAPALGAYVRIGRTAELGPIYRLRRYDKSRKTWTVSSLETNAESTCLAADLTSALAEGVAHLVKLHTLPLN